MESASAISTHTPPTESHCPRCGHEGRRVPAATLESLLCAPAQRRFTSLEGFWFCSTQACDVAYFHPGTGDLINCAEVRVPIFQKRTEPERLVCYCFQHTVAAIQREVRETGTSRIAADIKAKCAQRLNDCVHTNPQGACCLGNVERVVREATENNQPPFARGGACCCH